MLALGTAALAQDGPPTAAQIRQGIAGEIASFHLAPAEIYRVENRSVVEGNTTIPVRLYYPAKPSSNQRIIYQVHGGALVGGDLETHENISRELALRTQSIVVALDYRRPPEAPYPASIDDCAAVLRWIEANAASFGGDAGNLVLVGDSGGGLLITSLGMRLPAGLPARKLALVNPAVDLRNPGPYALVVGMYLNGHDASDSLASPLLARSVARYPTTLLITCEKDILRPQELEWRDKLKQAGVAVEWVDLPNKDHLGGYWAAAHPDVRYALDAVVRFILQP